VCSACIGRASTAARRCTRTAIKFDYEKHNYTTPPDESRFARVELFKANGHDAKLFVATDAKEATGEEIWADAQKRAAGPRRLGKDPMGEALAALPETQHIVIVRFGSQDLRVTFDRRISLDQAKAYVESVAARL
jgi:hypothetical protein